MNDSEETRRWIAYELHDRLLPWIHGAKMQLANLETTQGNEQRLEIAKHCLTIAAEEGRALISFLESDQNERVDSLRHSIEQFIELTRPLASQQGQQLTIVEPLNLPNATPAELSWPLLRIVQQSVLNAVQHAGPCEIKLSSQIKPTGLNKAELHVCIEDTGNGFDTQAEVESTHFGLSSMKQRAESINARLQIDSAVGRGTRIELTLPEKPTPLSKAIS